MVLDQGNIIDQGTHKQLFKRCKLYKELYQSEETAEQLTQVLLSQTVSTEDQPSQQG